MPAPYDYSSVLSPVDPGQAIMQGVLQGEQLLRNQQKYQQQQQQYQQQQQEYQRFQQQRVVEEERKALFDAKLEALMDNTSPEAVLELQLEFPEKFEVLGKIGTQFSENERQQKLDESIEIIGMVRFGKIEAVQDLYMERAELLEASGDTEAANNARLQAQQVEEDPDAFLTQMYMMQAAIGGPDKFIENMDKQRDAQAAYIESMVKAKREKSPSREAMRDAGIIGELIKTTDEDKYQNGLTIYRTKSGEIFGKGVDNVILQGDDLSKAIEQAASFGIDVQRRRSLGRETGRINAQTVRDAYKNVTEIRRNIRNLDQAIVEVRDNNAGVGVIQSKLPDWKASSVRLKNIQRQLGLDLIGMVTFGALSAGELKLALNTVLPTDLDNPALLKWLQDKKKAQLRTMEELQYLAVHLENGGLVSEFIKYEDGYDPSAARDPRSSVGEPETRSSEVQADFDFARSLIEPGAQ